MSDKESVNLAMQRELDHIDAKLEGITRALSQTADNHPDRRPLIDELGDTHEDRFDLLGEQNDIDKAIKYAEITRTLAPDGGPGLPDVLGKLGRRHGKRFQGAGDMDDNKKAIEYALLALASTPEGDSSWPRLMANLGAFHSGRFERLGELEDLGKAIEYESRAIALTPNGHPHLPGMFANLGGSYTHRFERLGELGDLEKSIEYESRALALTPDGHPDFPGILANLGGSLTHRFERLGELGDLEKSIEYESQALALTPDGHPDFPGILANLGGSLTHRFERLGELGDLEKSIEYQSRALALTPDGHPNLPSLLANLGTSYSTRFERLEEPADMEKAIEYESQAVILTPDDHPDLSSRLSNLSEPYSHRFERLRELADLEKAFDYQSKALALTPDGHPDLPNLFANLGVSYSHRFGHLHNQHDLDKAIEYMSRALDLTPHGHPHFPRRHFPFANNRLQQYLKTGDPSHLRDSLYSYRMATQSLAGSPRNKFRHAIGWAKEASKESSLNCIEAYQTAIDLLPQFIWLGATTTQRYEDLKSAESLATDAALAAILASDHALALEWLEHARCVVWNQSLMLRSPLDKLRSRDAALATRLQTVASQLHHTGSESRESQALASGILTHEQVARQHRQLAQEYNKLVSQARTLSGFEDFLRPKKANELVHAARSGPIVVINCHESRCDALVVLPGRDQVDHIPLPKFTSEKAQMTRLEMEKLVRSSSTRERGVKPLPLLVRGPEFQNMLASLWYDVVKPVLGRLGYTSQVSSESMPHITWCPTGSLSFLPLHAAGDYDQPQSKIYDYVISSYTPTLTALLSSTPSLLSRDSGVLAIGQPNTPSHSPLPGTVEELAFLKAHILDKFEFSQLMGDQATTKAVLEAMEQHDWVHLACHAHQNVSDPTKSGFFLHDGALDLASINQRSFRDKGLAYLSACQTATGDEKLPDEAIHLASGMLMAGYSSVIATMWSVRDADAPFVANKVYEQLMKDGSVGNGEAGKALHYAVKELREQVGEKEFGRWVPYIHIGT